MEIGLANFGRETTVKRQTNHNLKNEFPNIEDLSTLFVSKFFTTKIIVCIVPKSNCLRRHQDDSLCKLQTSTMSEQPGIYVVFPSDLSYGAEDETLNTNSGSTRPAYSLVSVLAMRTGWCPLSCPTMINVRWLRLHSHFLCIFIVAFSNFIVESCQKWSTFLISGQLLQAQHPYIKIQGLPHNLALFKLMEKSP